MSTSERCDLLLQELQAGKLSDTEARELSELLASDSRALDLYLDLCELDEHLALLPANTTGISVDDSSIVSSSHNSATSIVAVGVAIALCVLLALGIGGRTHDTDSSKNVAAANGRTASSNDLLAPPRRPPNPWKVINVSSSMNHPSLTEASIPTLTSAASRRITFNRDIRPILSETCFHCHGPDEEGRRADLRLDTLEGATTMKDERQPIAPGDLSKSEAWARIISDDPDLMMPPPESHLVLTEEQKTLFRRWIEDGAEYENHWAFISPVAPDIPQIDFTDEKKGTKWVRNAIDSFVARRLAEVNLAPSSEADARTLIRRLSLDLTGLPPTIEETDAFVRDYESLGEAAYQATITRLLVSPHFGERMALPWLDQARYADTNGYSIDGGRNAWLWRDWVIDAYNSNLPHDQFVIDQLAGDLLPDATDAQKIATGFNRNHMITHEGGTIPAENLTNYAADRVKTTSEVFLGLTMGCARCHDHKYDPISQKEYYQFFAFFNELEDRGLDGDGGRNAAPTMSAVTVLQSEELDELNSEIAALEEDLAQTTEGFDEWVDAVVADERLRGQGFRLLPAEMLDVSSPNIPGPFDFDMNGTVRIPRPGGGLSGFSHAIRLQADASGNGDLVSGIRIRFQPKLISVTTGDGAEKKTIEQNALTPFDGGVPKMTSVLVSATAQPAVQVDYHRQVDYSRITASSEAARYPATSVRSEDNAHWWQPAKGDVGQHLTLTFTEPVDPKVTPYLSVLLVFGKSRSLPYHWQIQPFSGVDTDSQWDESVVQNIAVRKSDPKSEANQQLLTTFQQTATSLEPLRIRLANLKDRRAVITEQQSAMVMNTAAKPRETFVLNRGQYDAPGDRVMPETPEVLPMLFVSSQVVAEPTAESTAEQTTVQATQSANRLDLAKWLVRADHPLTSRVAANRIWKLFFGTGLVATSADFGSQGEYPSHPELLDYLATRFVQLGWDRKQLIREIASSATYRQQSTSTPEQTALDPRNRLLARGPRFRLSAEFIRDQALAVSGLLVPRIGGPSVQPYQPAALWKEVSHFGSTPATKQVYIQDHGEKLYRRSLYTIVKRTSPHPAMAAFDAPNREMCTVDRGITNTPIQALVALNDPQFAEAARVLSSTWLIDSASTDDEARIRQAFESVVCRVPSSKERSAVLALLKSERERFLSSIKDALTAISVGESPRAADVDPVEHAAWMQVATLLLNLSETLTRI